MKPFSLILTRRGWVVLACAMVILLILLGITK